MVGFGKLACISIFVPFSFLSSFSFPLTDLVVIGEFLRIHFVAWDTHLLLSFLVVARLEVLGCFPHVLFWAMDII
jgi:hypothetical protein